MEGCAQPGGRIGVGVSAEVFAWGDGAVIKLFRPQFRYAVELEATCARAVHAAGVACPAVLEVCAVGERLGIVYERVNGPTLREALKGPTPDIAGVGSVLADLHVALHRHEAPALSPMVDAIEAALRSSPDAIRVGMQRRLARVPHGARIYHGDFHPGNVIMGTRPVLIDWVNAHRSHPALDVARSLILMRYQGVQGPLTERMQAELAVREGVASAYLARYLATGSVAAAEVEACEPLQAAMLLHRVPEHPLRDRLRALADR